MVRVDADTYAQLEAAAEKEQQPLAVLCRQVLMKFTKVKRKKST